MSEQRISREDKIRTGPYIPAHVELTKAALEDYIVRAESWFVVPESDAGYRMARALLAADDALNELAGSGETLAFKLKAQARAAMLPRKEVKDA